jgi:hypothetical protein
VACHIWLESILLHINLKLTTSNFEHNGSRIGYFGCTCLNLIKRITTYLGENSKVQ